MSDAYELSQWIKERDEAIYTFDVDTFKAFYRKWQKRGIYTEPLPSDEVIEITMRKMVCCLANPPKDKLAEARVWLFEHGYSWTITGDCRSSQGVTRSVSCRDGQAAAGQSWRSGTRRRCSCRSCTWTANTNRSEVR